MNDGLHTLGRWPRDVALRNRVAVDDGTERISYAELDTRADALARTLRAGGCRPGDRIATLTGNSAAHIVLFFACARARLVLVPLSWRLAAREIAEQIAHAEPALFVVEPAHAALATAARADGAVTAEELAAHCRAELARFKVPREFRFVAELPHSAVGKILRRTLREDS